MRLGSRPLLVAALASTPAVTPGAAPAQGAALAMPAAPPRSDTVPPAPARGAVTGQVVDAATGEALEGALVVLVARPDGVLPPGGTGASAFPAAAWRVRTDATGRYRFVGTTPGTYRLHATRLGYAAAAVDVTVADAAPEVSLGLAVAPLALRPVEVRAAARPANAPNARRARPDTLAARLAAVNARQRAYLTTDARELTRADVGEAVTLAESDLFRALHRLPGVSTRDEWAAELWTRGARPDLTRVTLDGMPLFSPVAAFGAFAAVNADAVGSATLLPGVRPARVGEGGAAVLDLRTRAGGQHAGRTRRGIAGVGEVGLASARLALDGSAADGRAAWAVTGRRSYLDGLAFLVGQQRIHRVPHFGDLTARGDLRLSPTQSLAVSGLVQRTAGRSSGPSDLTGGATWGNRLLRLTHSALAGSLRVTHTMGGSAHAFGAWGSPRDSLPYFFTDPLGAPGDSMQVRWGPTDQPPEVRVSALVLRGEFAPVPGRTSGGATASAEPTWDAGYEIAHQRTRYDGASRQFFTGTVYVPIPPMAPSAASDRLALAGGVTVGALWATRRWQPTSHLAIEPGLRLELAGESGPSVALRPAPRLAARYALGPTTFLSVAVGRSVQYAQALPRTGLENAVRFYPGALWLAAGRNGTTGDASGIDAPALTTDLVTVGGERWLGGGWLASANAYARRTRGLVTYDPSPGFAADVPDVPAEGTAPAPIVPARALFVVGHEGARGIELSARRLVGRTTATFGYSWSASTLTAARWRYPSPQDRPHALDATISHRLGARWRVGGALSAASGTPYARTVERVFAADSAWVQPLPLWEPWSPSLSRLRNLVRDAPGTRRNPSFLGADLLVEWTRPVRAWQLGAFAQLHSPLAAFTSDAYRGGELCYVPDGSAPGAVFGPAARCVSTGNTRESTLAVIPAVGLRVAF